MGRGENDGIMEHWHPKLNIREPCPILVVLSYKDLNCITMSQQKLKGFYKMIEENRKEI